MLTVWFYKLSLNNVISLKDLGLFPIWVYSPFGPVPHLDLFPIWTYSPFGPVPHLGMFPIWTCSPFGPVPHLDLFPIWACSPFGSVPHFGLFPISVCSPSVSIVLSLRRFAILIFLPSLQSPFLWRRTVIQWLCGLRFSLNIST